MKGLAWLGGEVEGIARKERSDKGSIKITERDLCVLRFVGEQYGVRSDQLARLLKRPDAGSLSESATRAVIARWEKAGLTSSRKVIANEPKFIWLTRKGLDEVGLPFKPWAPTAVSLRHIFWTNQVRLHTESRHPAATWRSERELRRGRVMQSISTTQAHEVDAEIELARGVVGVEVELSAKSTERRRSIMAEVAERYATVWYFAPSNVAALLQETALFDRTTRPHPDLRTRGGRMIQRQYPHPHHSLPRPHPPQEDALTKYGPFIVLIPLVIMVAAIVLPAIAVASIGLGLAALLRLRWWALALMWVLSLVVVLSLGFDPAQRVERVIRRTQGAWMSPNGDTSTGLEFGKKARTRKDRQTDMFDRLVKRIPSLMKTGLPASIPIGLLFGAILLAWTQGDMEIRPDATTQRSSRTRSGRVQAQKRVGSTPDAIRGRAVLGPAISGDLPREWLARKPFRGEFLVFDEANLGRHMVVVGQPGSGKTVSLLQLAYLAAKVYGWRVYFLDGKGDHATQREFVATMFQAGLSENEVAVFPQEPFDGWRTNGMLDERYAQLLNRLLGVVQFTEPYYEDATRAFVSQALALDGSCPESSQEYLERLESLVTGSAVEQRREAMGALLRYRAFFDSFRGKLDGSWSFEDKRAAYVLLEGLAQPKEAGRLAAYLFESFKHFAAHAKHPSDRVLLIVDEFPAIQEDADVAGLVERLRSFGCSVALSAQSYEGLGTSRDRIITAARSLIVHSCPGAEEIVRLAGTQEAYAMTHQVDYQVGPTGLGSARAEQRFRVDPNLLGSLHEGEAFVISQRRAQLVRVARRPIPDEANMRAAEFLRPKAQVELLERRFVTPPEQDATKQAIDW